MASSSAALVTLLVTSCAAMAGATTYDVGGMDKGWAIGVDYANWTIGKSFAVGDELVFNHGTTQHTVAEVNQSDYASCSRTSAQGVRNDFGQTTVTLTTPGTHYYICIIPRHCAGGMKLAVTVAAGGSGSGSPSGGGVTPSGASQRVLTMGVVVAAVAGALVIVALF